MNKYIIHEEHYKGFRIQIEYDFCDYSPRENDNLGKIVAFHSRFNLVNESNMTRDEAVEFYENYNEEDHLIMEIYMYEHGQVGLSTSRAYPYNCRWDSSHIGFIYAEIKALKEEYGNDYDLEKIATYLDREVKEYGQYLNGEVYCYDVSKVVECENCHHEEFKPLEGCGGYIGDWDYALADAKSAIDAEA